MTAADYEAEMKAPVVRRRPAIKYTRQATAERLYQSLASNYDPTILDLLITKLTASVRASAKQKIASE